VRATLGFVGRLPGGADVVFDYPNPIGPSDPAEYTAARATFAARVAAVGETLRSAYETAALHDQLRAMGFRTIEDLGPQAIRERYFPGAPPAGSDRGGHVIRASSL
jgi:hypothetical protein